jgi:hypothetical protein
MSTELVRGFKIKVPKDISFQTKPDDAVVTYKATLFRKEGNDNVPVKKWNASQLEKGVTFTADEEANRFEIVLTATVKDDAIIATTTSFDPAPPQKFERDVKLRKNEGVIERLWLFLPIKKKES